jgi:hypothetical protein
MFTRAPAGLLALALLAACADSPVAPGAPEPSTGLTKIACTVTVQTGTVSCSDPAPSTGARTMRLMGGQDKYVRLTSSNTSYDVGTQLFRTNVTVQNLLQKALGTNGTTTTGVMVFFAGGPTVTGGTGSVSVSNATGSLPFVGSEPQQYFLYNEVLQPYQISQSMEWVFGVPSTVTSFSFLLFVAADQSDETASMLDKTWTGLTSTAWALATNWTNSAVPDSTSTVAVAPASMLSSGNFPVLAANADVTNLRVGTGSTLGLGAFTIRVRGTADAPGAISNGTVLLTGSMGYMRGTFPSLVVNGSRMLQGSTVTSGAVSIQDGSLTLQGNPLSIQIP